MTPCPSFDIPSSASDAPGGQLRTLAGRIRQLGGFLTGDNTRGTFTIPVPFAARPVRGTYLVTGGAVRVGVADRPALLPGGLIEEAIRGGVESDAPPAGDPIRTEFTVEVRFLGGLTPTQQDVFMGAAARWSRVIVGDLPTVRLPSGETVDDLVIDARGAFIDGAGRVLGRAGPTAVRPDSMLPVSGIMEFDTADLARMEMEGTLENVIVHEMGHVLGLGSLWDAEFFGLVNGAGGRNPLYVGANAAREFAALLGVPDPRPVPVENEGGPGTADAHWREAVFLNELMTGFLGTGRNPLSRMTVAALQDLGYEVSYDAAEAYTLPGEMELRLRGLSAHVVQCGGDPRMVRTRPVVLPESCMVPGG